MISERKQGKHIKRGSDGTHFSIPPVRKEIPREAEDVSFAPCCDEESAQPYSDLLDRHMSACGWLLELLQDLLLPSMKYADALIHWGVTGSRV